MFEHRKKDFFWTLFFAIMTVFIICLASININIVNVYVGTPTYFLSSSYYLVFWIILILVSFKFRNVYLATYSLLFWTANLFLSIIGVAINSLDSGLSNFFDVLYFKLISLNSGIFLIMGRGSILRYGGTFLILTSVIFFISSIFLFIHNRGKLRKK